MYVVLMLKKKIKEFVEDLRKKSAGMVEFRPELLDLIDNLPDDKKKEFIERLRKNTFRIEKTVMEEVFREGILTKEEYEKEFRHKYISSVGCDSFPELMQCVMFNKRQDNPEEKTVFVTTNEKIIKDRRRLSKKFDIIIKTPKEAIKIIKKGEDEPKEMFQAM